MEQASETADGQVTLSDISKFGSINFSRKFARSKTVQFSLLDYDAR
jgi:hypothetical protein